VVEIQEVDEAEQAKVSVEAMEEEDSRAGQTRRKVYELQTTRNQVLSPWNWERNSDSYI
jgi:hypothetical protein